MNIISFSFYAAVLLALILYYGVPVRFRWMILCGFSGYFVISANGIKLALYMLAVILLTYAAAILVDKYRENVRISRAVLICGIAADGISLVAMKELNFFIHGVRAAAGIFGKAVPLQPVSILAPIGISYYTLSLIGYLVDVYWETAKAEKNPLKVALFTGYFPLLIAGPIVRKREVFDELIEGQKFHYENVTFGLQRIVWGFFKKLVISERFAVIVNAVYGNYFVYSGLYIWVAAICFLLQLYTDFSGGIDICLGVSQLFGIRLPENFDLPFLSRSVSEFWRRWHITLGGWLRDYIYYPMMKSNVMQDMGAKSKKILGKKKGKNIPLYIVTLVSWFLVGFWHGGGWNYIFGVGLFYGLVIIAGQMFEPLSKKLIKVLKIRTECFSWHLFQMARTFLVLVFANSLFRAASLKSGFQMWKMAFSLWNPWIFFDQSLYGLGLNQTEWEILMFGMLVLIVCGLLRYFLKISVRQWLLQQNMLFQWGVMILLVVWVFVYGYYGPGYDAGAFIYFQF